METKPQDEAKAAEIAKWLRNYVSDSEHEFYALCRLSQAARIIEQLSAHLAAAKAETAEFETQIEALNSKLLSLAPHGSCGCSFDRPGDLCMHHSPKLAAAKAEIEELKALLDRRA